MGDIIGRKGTLFVGAFVFTIGGAIQTFTTGFYVMIIGRVISGFGVGLLSCVTLQQPLLCAYLPQCLARLFRYIRVKFLLQIMQVHTLRVPNTI